MKFKSLITAVVVVLAVTACQPPLPSPTAPAGPMPLSNFQWIIGASLEAQIIAYGSTEGDAFEWVAEAGQGVVGMSDVIDWAIGSRPTSITFASILDNNALKPEGVGWNYTDEERYQAKIDLMDPATCLKIVLPWWVAEPWPGAYQSLEHVRAWAQQLQRDKLVIIDWRTYAEANPGEFADFVHMGTPAAVEARYQMITQATCS